FLPPTSSPPPLGPFPFLASLSRLPRALLRSLRPLAFLALVQPLGPFAFLASVSRSSSALLRDRYRLYHIAIGSASHRLPCAAPCIRQNHSGIPWRCSPATPARTLARRRT
ncbi:hypothetical protein B0H13DRAFT_2684178, partial [Mycena leptocephala]